MQRATLGEKRPGFRKHYHLLLIHVLNKQLHLHYTADKVNKDLIRQDAHINGLSMLEGFQLTIKKESILKNHITSLPGL